jgi:hypothetical protein
MGALLAVCGIPSAMIIMDESCAIAAESTISTIRAVTWAYTPESRSRFRSAAQARCSPMVCRLTGIWHSYWLAAAMETNRGPEGRLMGQAHLEQWNVCIFANRLRDQRASTYLRWRKLRSVLSSRDSWRISSRVPRILSAW